MRRSAEQLRRYRAIGRFGALPARCRSRAQRIDGNRITVKPMKTLDAVARAIGMNQVVQRSCRHRLRANCCANQAKLIGWYSDLDAQQFGALFVSAKIIAPGVTVVAIRAAYRRGAADYAAALLRKDRSSKRTSDIKVDMKPRRPSRAMSIPTAGTECCRHGRGRAYFIEPQARLDAADIARQIAWYKSQGLVDKASTRARSSMPASSMTHFCGREFLPLPASPP